MLIHQHRIAIRVHHDAAARPGGSFVSFGNEVGALTFEFLLQVTHIGELVQGFGVLAPAGVEREHILFKYALGEVVAFRKRQYRVLRPA